MKLNKIYLNESYYDAVHKLIVIIPIIVLIFVPLTFSKYWKMKKLFGLFHITLFLFSFFYLTRKGNLCVYMPFCMSSFMFSYFNSFTTIVSFCGYLAFFRP